LLRPKGIVVEMRKDRTGGYVWTIDHVRDEVIEWEDTARIGDWNGSTEARLDLAKVVDTVSIGGAESVAF
jgi:hypothetical protein